MIKTKKVLDNQKGFSFVELLIVLAILSIVMIALSQFMGTSVMAYQRTNADITVHNSAQQTYNQISNSIMQANDVYVCGMTSTAETFNLMIKADEDSLSTLGFGSKDGKKENNRLVSYNASGVKDGNVYNKKSGAKLKWIYAVDGNKFTIQTFYRINGAATDTKYIICKQQEKAYDSSGNGFYKDIYVYYYLDEKEHDLYMWKSDSLNMYVTKQTDDAEIFCENVTGFKTSSDTDGNGLQVELQFEDRKMEYNSNGMIKIRNSNVLVGRDD